VGLLVGLLAASVSAEAKAEPVAAPTADEIQEFDPFDEHAESFDPFDVLVPLQEAAYFPEPPAIAPRPNQVVLQTPANTADRPHENTAPTDATEEPLPNPCEAVDERPLHDLGINITLPNGLLPKDYANECWAYLNATGGPGAAIRGWPTLSYYWDATCLCYRPLYFEETNLERYGYGCCCACLQPAVSAAHFFGTVPALPYCMAADCPCECQYTLGHYRPGSCPPWRPHWPSCKPIAAASEAGVLTGLIFLIP
jgi:hypothetical protein